MNVLLIIYVSIVFIITFGLRAILLIEKIEKPRLLVIFIFGLLWPVILLGYTLNLIYRAIKNIIIHL